ncbi:MAG TPA: aldo/keto reductase [Armatimonadetes bacterium]|nr:aldo/keto reductase [Armatimonadota bacterium]
MAKDKLTRREFIRNGSRAIAGVVLGSAVLHGTADGVGLKPAERASRILNYNPQMKYRRLGKTDLVISEISLGGHWKTYGGGRVWLSLPNDEVPADVAKNRTDVISKCIDAGINYLDITTPAECLAYGVALRGRREKMYVGADDCILCIRDRSKRTVKAQIFNVEECLRRLKFDYLDIWRPQADVMGRHTDDEIATVVEAFEKLHEQGKVRWLGISSHNRKFLQHVIEAFPQFSIVIFPYTAKSKMQEMPAGPGGADFSKSIFQVAREHDVGIITIKPFAGGSLFRTRARFPVREPGNPEDHKLARLTLQYILSNPYITATVPGMTTVEEVENNVRASYERVTSSLTPEDAKRLAEAVDEMWRNLPPEYKWLREWEWV